MSKIPLDDELDRHTSRLLRAVGNSPLVRLALPHLPRRARLFAKLETTNPGGSLKDRPVLRILQSAQATGKLEGGRRLLDVAGPNAAISYGVYGAALGIPITLVLPEETPRGVVDRLRGHGVETVLCETGLEAARAEARQLLEAAPDRFYFADLENNEDNWLAHYETTGHEILAQVFDAVADEPDAWVMGVGSGGTLCGVAKKLLRRKSDLQVVAVVPAQSETIAGLRPLPPASPCFDPTLIQQEIPVTAADAARACHDLLGLGFCVGPSSGAQVAAAVALLKGGRAKIAVTVLCDSGERYAGSPGGPKTRRRAKH